jgi:hypothetical protein
MAAHLIFGLTMYGTSAGTTRTGFDQACKFLIATRRHFTKLHDWEITLEIIAVSCRMEDDIISALEGNREARC